jgi:hypothetical protein
MYRERIAPTMTLPEASRQLFRDLPAAELLPQPTFSGQQRWLLPGGAAVAVCKPDPKLRRRIAVTVLGPDQMHDVDAVDEVLEAYQRVAAAVEPQPSAPPSQGPDRPRKAKQLPNAASSVWEQHYLLLERKHDALLAEHQRHLKLYADLKELRSAEGATLRAQVEHLSAQLRDERKRGNAAEHAAKTVGDQLAKAQRVAGETNEHARHLARDAAKKTIALRVAVIELRRAAERGDEGALRALADVAGVDAGLVSDAFCYPERFTAEERREGARAEGSAS